jgi:hypothetical protein
MTTEEPLTVGVFENLDQAQRTIDELQRRGFNSEEIGIIGHVGDETPVSTPPQMRPAEHNATRGVWSGALFGALVGAVVIVVIPGVAWVTQTGRWLEILCGIVLGAGVGGVLFAFRSFTYSLGRGNVYESELKKGRFVVTVKNPHRLQEALSVLGRRAIQAEADRG